MSSSSPRRSLAAVPESDKTLTVSAFVATSDVDDVYFDRPYYLGPSDRSAEEAFALIREGLRKAETAAIAQTVLFRRVRTVLISAPSTRGSRPPPSTSITRSARPRTHSPMCRRSGSRAKCWNSPSTSSTPSAATSIPKSLPRPLRGGARRTGQGEARGPRPSSAPKQPKPQRADDLMAALRESAGLGAEGAIRSRQGEEEASGAPCVRRDGEPAQESGLDGWRSSSIAPSAISPRPRSRGRRSPRRPGAATASSCRSTTRGGSITIFGSELDGVLEELGGDARPEPHSRREAARGRGRGPSARLRLVRGHDPQGRIWRRRGPCLGSRHVDADRRSAQGPRQGTSRVRASWAEAQRPVASRPHA